jgi:hypothetical protein
MDPRVTTPAAGLAAQNRWSTKLVDLMNVSYGAAASLRVIRGQLDKLKSGPFADAAADLDKKLAALSTLPQLNGTLAGLLNVIGGSDAAPTTQAVRAAVDAETQTNAQLTKWREIQTKDVAALNAKLKQAGLPLL